MADVFVFIVFGVCVIQPLIRYNKNCQRLFRFSRAQCGSSYGTERASGGCSRGGQRSGYVHVGGVYQIINAR